MRILAIIPARGGSKGVPRKNIKELGGKPLIQYTIDAAVKSGCFSKIIVSTEDEEIASIAKDLGAAVPFLRPKELAEDSSPTIDAIIHALELLKLNDQHFDAVCILQATSPLRSADLISNSIDKFKAQGTDSLVSVRAVPHEYNPHWVFEPDSEDELFISTGEKRIISRRQDLPPAYIRDGAIYLVRTEILMDKNTLYGDSVGYIDATDEPYVNIDTMDDWKKAETLINEMSK